MVSSEQKENGEDSVPSWVKITWWDRNGGTTIKVLVAVVGTAIVSWCLGLW